MIKDTDIHIQKERLEKSHGWLVQAQKTEHDRFLRVAESLGKDQEIVDEVSELLKQSMEERLSIKEQEKMMRCMNDTNFETTEGITAFGGLVSILGKIFNKKNTINGFSEKELEKIEALNAPLSRDDASFLDGIIQKNEEDLTRLQGALEEDGVSSDLSRALYSAQTKRCSI